MDNGAILKRFCDLVLQDETLQPQYSPDGKLLITHCNQATRIISQALGCHEFDDPAATADIMFAIMSSNGSGKWKQVQGSDACIHALTGGISIAALPSDRLQEAHGHICVVYPVGMQPSPSLKKDVPMLCNVGRGDPASPLVKSSLGNFRTRKNWICKASEAFPVRVGEPCYFIWVNQEG